MVTSEARLHELFVLNVALQLFDGVASWQGVHLWGEGNPVLSGLMAMLGVEFTLLLFKANACGFLVLLRRCWRTQLAHDALVVLAALYTGLSLVPWTLRFVSLLGA